MAEAVRDMRRSQEEWLPEPPNIDHLITEDDTPVYNIFSEKQQRLLVDSLYSSWKPARSFVALANVGLFYSVHESAVVPDMLLSLDVRLPEELWEKGHRSYFLWEYGKTPEVVVEIVSNTRGGEIQKKTQIDAETGVWDYVVFDPQNVIQKTPLRIYEFTAGQYIPRVDLQLERVGLKLQLWDGEFENKREQWLRWCDADGNMLLTGAERAEQERQRAERLAAQLRALGIEPDI